MNRNEANALLDACFIRIRTPMSLQVVLTAAAACRQTTDTSGRLIMAPRQFETLREAIARRNETHAAKITICHNQDSNTFILLGDTEALDKEGVRELLWDLEPSFANGRYGFAHICAHLLVNNKS